MRYFHKIAITLLVFLLVECCAGFALGTTLSLPLQLQVIEPKAFFGDTSLDVVEVPLGTKRIESLAFANSSIQLAILPDTIEYIADDAFQNTQVTIRASEGSYAHRYAVLHNHNWEDTSSGLPDNVTYRALLIGEENFNPICTRNRGDVNLMHSIISGRKGGTGSSYTTVNCQYNLTPIGVQSAITSTFSGADSDDVSLFFIATHGDVYSSDAYAGALATVDSSGNEDYILLSQLANWLNAVPGRVIVIIESCGSGAAIYQEGVSENSMRRVSDNSAAFASQIISAFASVDSSITSEEQYIYDADGNIMHVEYNTGELRQSKFYVLAASRYKELSWGTESGPYNFFTYHLTNGVGTTANMPADANSNGEITMHELFTYIKTNCDPMQFWDSSTGAYVNQHVQVYPTNSSFVLFKQ
ncbi:MAG: leucine-rich repeat protein [Clostridia bacterium]|nr:leucine-rich repeat protein [Clostridia bacterium]